VWRPQEGPSLFSTDDGARVPRDWREGGEPATAFLTDRDAAGSTTDIEPAAQVSVAAMANGRSCRSTVARIARGVTLPGP
jgi:hypothetical protein